MVVHPACGSEGQSCDTEIFAILKLQFKTPDEKMRFVEFLGKD